MSQRVIVATASAFLALVVKKTLGRSSHLEPSGDPRTACAALDALRACASLAVVDAELLCDADGAELVKELGLRRWPAVIVDARGRGTPSEVACAPGIVVIRGRSGGELDLEVVENELLPALGRALREHSGLGSEVRVASLPERVEPYGAALELIVLGVSTGGPSLLLRLFEKLREPAIPMLVVQHMPESETAGFALRLSEHSGLLVCEVASGPLPAAGVIGVVRGGCDFRVLRSAGGLQLRPASLVGNPFHPNLDEVLASAVASGIAVGAAILTGMGQDGALGALAMAKKGLPVIAQRPDTCAVSGMPQAVIDNGAARSVQAPESIANTLNGWSEAARKTAQAGGAPCLP